MLILNSCAPGWMLVGALFLLASFAVWPRVGRDEAVATTHSAETLGARQAAPPAATLPLSVAAHPTMRPDFGDGSRRIPLARRSPDR